MSEAPVQTSSGKGHAIIAGFQGGEDWFVDYGTGEMMKDVELLSQYSGGPTKPKPAKSVPANWEGLLRSSWIDRFTTPRLTFGTTVYNEQAIESGEVNGQRSNRTEQL